MLVNGGIAHFDGDQSVTAIADRTVPGELDLAKNDDRADDQHYRYRELQHHQGFARNGRQASYPEGTLEHLDRLKRGQVQRRIASRDEARRTGEYYAAADVHAELEAMLAATKKRKGAR